MTDESEYFSEDDVFIKRDENNDVLPVEADALGYGKCKVIPMTYGEAERVFGDGGESVRNVDTDQVADVLSNHVVEPDLSGLTEEDVRDRMQPMAPQALLMAVMNASGLNGQVTVNEEGEASIDFEGNS